MKVQPVSSGSPHKSVKDDPSTVCQDDSATVLESGDKPGDLVKASDLRQWRSSIHSLDHSPAEMLRTMTKTTKSPDVSWQGTMWCVVYAKSFYEAFVCMFTRMRADVTE